MPMLISLHTMREKEIVTEFTSTTISNRTKQTPTTSEDVGMVACVVRVPQEVTGLKLLQRMARGRSCAQKPTCLM
eukprot:2843414-Pyramimonas_sp.AAC.1